MSTGADERAAQEWITHAKRGDFTSAWKASERILARHKARPDFKRPRHMQSVWTGEPLQGKRVLIRCYHGLGDTIQFIRYVPQVKALASEVIVWAPAPLVPLLKSVAGIDRLLPLHDGTPDVAYDVDVELMELPFVFRTTLDTIPRSVPYLSVTPAKLPGLMPHIGIAWRAGNWDGERSIPFSVLEPLLDDDRFNWYGQQLGCNATETHPNLVDMSVANVYETARRVAALDLLITIDSMPAHLAGALGVPVWTLLLKEADWRWMEERDDSPWYPTMRLFRQHRQGDWGDALERVKAALINFQSPTSNSQGGR